MYTWSLISALGLLIILTVALVELGFSMKETLIAVGYVTLLAMNLGLAIVSILAIKAALKE